MSKVMSEYEIGSIDATDFRFALVASQFNKHITDRLLEGATGCLEEHGVPSDQYDVSWVPGAFELPLVAKRYAEEEAVDAVICLGCVIRGDTPHFDYVCTGAAEGIQSVALETNLPVIFSVLTTDNEQQALARAGKGRENAGYNGVISAVQMIQLLKSM